MKHKYTFNIKEDVVWVTALLLTISAPNILEFYGTPGPLQLARVVFGVILFTLPITIFKIKPRIYLVLLSPLFLLVYADFVHLVNYGKHLSVGAVASFFYSDSKEALEFLWHTSSTTLPTILAIAIAAIILFVFAPAKLPALKLRYLLILIIVLLTIPQIYDIKAAFPGSTTFGIYRFYAVNKEFNDQAAKRKFLRYDVIKNNTNADDVFVLIMGETVYKRHMGLYGYERNTTPYLSKRQNVIVFDDVSAPANLTQNSIPLLLTPATAKDPQLFYRYQSIVGLANAAGFDTYWLSNQSKMNATNNEVSVLAEEAKFRVFKDTGLSGSLDGGLIANLSNALQEEKAQKFIVLHLLGSHVKYSQRYPKEFNNFSGRPIQAKTNNLKVFENINSYDNSILYSDYVIDQVIAKLDVQKKSGCVVYIADHGEYLSNTKPISGHGYPTALQPEAEIPLIVWCSDKYHERHPEIIKSMAKNKGLQIAGEDLFYSMANLLNIKFSQMDEKHSFFNANYHPPVNRLIMNGQEQLNDVQSLRPEPDL